MNELIKQAAEDCHLKHGIGKTGGYYSIIVNHSISFAKEKGFELVRVEGDMKAIEHSIKSKMSEEEYGKVPQIITDIALEAYAIGAAKERERMGKFYRWAFINDWDYNYEDDLWWNQSDWNNTQSKTFSELIEIFNTQNKEG